MYTSNKRELLTGIQYLLIGTIAEGIVIHWFSQRSPVQRLFLWLTIATVLSILRFVILSLSEWTRKDNWQSVSRRNW